MTWEAATLLIAAGAGVITLCLGQIREILIKAAEIVDAWNRLRRAIARAKRGKRRD
uniref:hypothetical protein n=1 Tax=Herbidospora sakaeratensis TaxID=564415 RepID=UPI000AC1AA0E|nr:hypothetical protein [Herbidospora sakaeratensis]